MNRKTKRAILIFGLTILPAVFWSAACGTAQKHDQTTMNRNAADRGAMNHNSMNHNSMNHAALQSDPNAASAPFDLQFLDTMVHHHEGAVDMAETILRRSENEDLKRFAQKIVDDQKREITQMKVWREDWFPGAPPSKNMGMPGMQDSMKMMDEGVKKMETATGTELDALFLDLMIPHHEGAVVMSKEALLKSQRAEIKTLAETIVREQNAEIKQMSDWKAQWKK
jgi:uncharacterized protein (DUF305 family)